MRQIFTRQEQRVLLFLLSGILIGAGVKLFEPDVEYVKVSDDDFSAFESRVAELKSSKKEEVVTEKNQKQKNHQEFKIDLNKASIDELVRLPKVGPVLAKRIVEYRQKNGNFENVEQLIKVKGVGKKTLAHLKPFIFVTPSEK